MPNQSQSGWHTSPWHRCDRCGCDFRVTDLTWQNGLLLCKEDWDDPIAWNRDRMIADVLSEAGEEAGVAEILKGHENVPEPAE